MVYDVFCFLHVFILAIVSIKECSCLFGVGMDRFALIITLLSRSSFLGESYFYSISPSDNSLQNPRLFFSLLSTLFLIGLFVNQKQLLLFIIHRNMAFCLKQIYYILTPYRNVSHRLAGL